MMEEEAAAPPQDHLVAMDVDGGIVVVESCDAKDHQGSSMHGSFQQEEEGRSGPVTAAAAADPETSTFPSSATQETKKTLSTATACGRGGAGAGAAGGGEEAGEDYEASGSRDDGQLLEVFNNNKKQRKRSSDSLAASDSASLGGGGGGGGLDGEAAAASHHHVCRQCKREFSSGRALGGHMRAHGSLAMEDGNARVTWNNSSETVVAAAVASDKELQQQLTSSSSWRARGTSYLVNPASDLDSCRDESSPSLASSRPLRLGTHSCSRSEEAGRVRKRGRVSSSAADAAAELVGRCQEPEEDQDHEEEEATSVLLGSSSSSEATGNSKMQQAEEFDVTEGTSYMCQICEEEFETARDLKLHKKEHPQYILRMNPKRSQRFLDQDSSDLLLAATAAATGQSTHHHQPKKAALSSGMGTTEESKLPISCTECEKKFGSMKALFGHMRCHPEREWRGIQPPPDRSTAAAGHAANHGSSRKKRRPPPPVVPLPTADPESESETETDSKPPAAAAGKLGSDLDSDTESIEAAYINGSSRQSSGPPGWRTKKRTKRTKQTVRSLQAVVTGGGGGGGGATAAAAPEEEEEEEPGPSSSSTPTETQVHKDIVFALMLLRPKRVAQLSHPPSLEQQQCKQEGSRSMNVAEKFKAPNVDKYKSTACHDTHMQHQHQQYHRDPDVSKGKRHVEDAVEDAALISDGQDFDEMETGEQGGGMRMMYQCATCKRIFKSHQALGGHRASHKKVKGCFARTSVNDEEGFGRQQDQSTEDNNKEDIPDEDFLKAEEQLLLPHEPQEPSHHSEEDAELPCDYLTVARGDNEEMLNAVRKSKGHECSICHRIFNSGQALGGHKRCHWGGGTGTAGPNEATTTVHNLNNNNAVVMVNGDQPGLQESHPIQGLPVPGGQQNKGMQEGIIDLNMPAPECVEEIVEEQIASASASGMAPPIEHHHPSYLPFPTFTTDSPAFVSQQPCSDLVEKCTQQQHIKFLGESMDTKVDKSLETIASNGATDAGGDFRTGDAADQAMDPGMKGTDAGGNFRTGDAAEQAMDPGMKGTNAGGNFRTGDAADQAMDPGMKGTDAVGDFRTGDAADQAMDPGMKGTDAGGDFRTGDAADQAMDPGMKGTDAVGDFRTGDAVDRAMDQGMKGTDAVGDFRTGDAADQAMDPGMKGTDAGGDFRTGDAADQAMDQGMKGTDAVGNFRIGDAADQAMDQGMKGTDAVGNFRIGDAADQAMDQGMKGTDAVGDFRTGDATDQGMDQGMKGTELQHMKSCWGDSLDTRVDKSLEPITSVVATDAVGFRTGDADAMDRGMNNFSNTCDQGFTSLEHLSSHQNTHATIMGPAPSLTA